VIRVQDNRATWTFVSFENPAKGKHQPDGLILDSTEAFLFDRCHGLFADINEEKKYLEVLLFILVIVYIIEGMSFSPPLCTK
jgi:hypothetical protein